VTGEHYNDFVIHNRTQDQARLNSGNYKGDYGSAKEINGNQGEIGKRHLVIKYSEVDRRYYLRDLGDGSGTFVRIEN
jgi:hypothetical protein